MKPLTVARDLKRRRARERTRLFTAEGVRCVEELLASSVSIRSIVVAPALSETDRGSALGVAARAAAAARGFEVTEVSDRDLAGASDTDTHQGILAIATQPERSFASIGTGRIIVLLDGVQDPGNVGTILRTAEAFAVAATIALPGTADLWNPKVVRSGMGALFSQHAFSATAADALAFLQRRSIPLWATAASGEPLARRSQTCGTGDGGGDGTVAIVVGNEGSGVSGELARAADRVVAIPIHGVESLNVAVATGILLYAITTA